MIICHNISTMRLCISVVAYLASLALTVLASSVLADDAGREAFVCGRYESSMFRECHFWSWFTEPSESALRDISGIEKTKFQTSDGKNLVGYLIRGRGVSEDVRNKGYILIVQGNAHRARAVVLLMHSLADYGFDVYVYDYRGYGYSEGVSSLKAISIDYSEIISELNNRGYKRRLIYSASFGGLVALHSLGGKVDYDKMIVDSIPGSAASVVGCPVSYDPIENIPQDARNLLFIRSGRDHLFSRAQFDELFKVATQRGAQLLEDNEFHHPLSYASGEPGIHQQRLSVIVKFFEN